MCQPPPQCQPASPRVADRGSTSKLKIDLFAHVVHNIAELHHDFQSPKLSQCQHTAALAQFSFSCEDGNIIFGDPQSDPFSSPSLSRIVPCDPSPKTWLHSGYGRALATINLAATCEEGSN